MGSNFEFRIAKPGTRPKGGSPKDNFELMKGARRFERGSRDGERGIRELENS